MPLRALVNSKETPSIETICTEFMISIIDTSAWVEYFEGSAKGIFLKNLLEDKKNKFVTMESCIAELVGVSLRQGLDFRQLKTFVKENSVILPILTETWISAAKIRHVVRKTRPQFGLLDALLLAKQKELNCSLISSDSHFKALKNVVYIGD